MDYLSLITHERLLKNNLSLINSISSQISTSNLFGFEIYLNNERAGNVDFLVNYTQDTLQISNSLYPKSFWDALSLFRERWNEEQGLLSKVSSLWLEFDLDLNQSRIDHLLPSIFIELKSKLNFDSINDILNGWPYNYSSDVIYNIQDLFHDIPENAKLIHLGKMLSRPDTAEKCRVVIKHIYLSQIPFFLDKIRYKFDFSDLIEISQDFIDLDPLISLSLDISQGIESKIGFEISCPNQIKQKDFWCSVLSRMAQKGLCSEDYKHQLLAWPGILTQNQDAKYWPKSLELIDSFMNNRADSVFYKLINHVKFVYQPNKPLLAKAYLAMGHQWLDRKKYTSISPIFAKLTNSHEILNEVEQKEYFELIQKYYNTSNSTILENIGQTYQSGLFIQDNLPLSYRESNIECSRRADIRPGEYILDAGCGACGPAIDIAQHIPTIRIEGVTLSLQQQLSARQFIKNADLSDRVNVWQGDYHNLSFPKAVFDRVIFLESAGYSYDLSKLFQEIYRVIKPGGSLYIKEPFLMDKSLSQTEYQSLLEFNEVYKYRTQKIQYMAECVQGSGFRNIKTKLLDNQISTQLFSESMFAMRGENQRTLSSFGLSHYRNSTSLPVVFGEIKAIKPSLI